jgi:hypothetical protein
VSPVIIPFFSAADDQIPAYFLEVSHDYVRRPTPVKTVASQALTNARTEVSISALPATVHTGQTFTFFVVVKNTGERTWASQFGPGQQFGIGLRAGWTNFGKEPLIPLPYDLPPGEAVILPVTLHASGSGEREVELYMDQVGVAPIGEKISRTIQVTQ